MSRDILPLPVLRERAGVRVIWSVECRRLCQRRALEKVSLSYVPNHPHPSPLPGYRERG
jgi:hypothetical protein